MTTPSIRFRCPKCGATKLHITDGPHYCQCPGKGRTETGWDFSGPTSKVRTRKLPTGTRMVKEIQ
jgi:hypothetical protein